jgi:hypothetical protein
VSLFSEFSLVQPRQRHVMQKEKRKKRENNNEGRTERRTRDK